nr:hypothetical protein [Desulforapulum autotrophicum]
MIVHQIFKSPEIQIFTAGQCPIRIDIPPFKDFPCVMQCLDNCAFTGTVGTKQEGDRFEINMNRLTDSLKIFDGHAG